MHAVNLSALDLNLLVVLDALLRERHVGRAAAAIGRSQPAVSHALSRLRSRFSDPLLVVSGRRMVLSPRAESLREPLAALMRDVGGLFRESTFDPASSSRAFRLMMPDFVAATLMPPLLANVGKSAPGVRFEIAEWRGERTLTKEYLETIDIVISNWNGRYFNFKRAALFEDRDVLGFGTSNRKPAAARNIESFLSAAHVAVVGPGERQDPVDTWLHSLGHKRNIALSVPTYLLALRVVAAGDVVGVLPLSITRSMGAAIGVTDAPLPIDPGIDSMDMHFAAAAESDPASKWLRKQIVETYNAGLAPRLTAATKRSAGSKRRD